MTMHLSINPVMQRRSLSACVVSLALALLLSSAVAAQQAEPAPGLRLRNIILKKLPADAKIIGLEFTIVHIDNNGVRKLVDRAPEQYPFNVGDSFLVKIKPQDDVFVYVFTEGPDGKRARLLPESSDEPLSVKAGQEIDLPDDGALFTFERPAGEEKLLVVALKEHNPNLLVVEQAAFKAGGKTLSSDASTPVGAGAPEKLSAVIDGLKDRRDNGLRLRGSPALKKAAEGDLAASAAKPIQLEVTPEKDSPSTEVVGVGTSEIVVGISLKSQAGPAR